MAEKLLLELKKALIRVYDRHGHEYNCSALRGSYSDCSCGWIEIIELVRKIRPKGRN